MRFVDFRFVQAWPTTLLQTYGRHRYHLYHRSRYALFVFLTNELFTMCVGTTHRYEEIARNINCFTFGFWLRMISLKKSFSACWLSVERINFIYSLKTVRQTSVNKRSRAENSRLVWWGLLWIIEIKEREKKERRHYEN